MAVDYQNRRERRIDEFVSGAFPQSQTLKATVGTVAIKVLSANSKRTKLVIQNRVSNAKSIFLGGDNSLTNANGIEIGLGSIYFDDAYGSVFTGEVWLVADVASTGEDIRIRQEWRESR